MQLNFVDLFSVVWLFLTFHILFCQSAELTFELPDNERMCFEEVIEKGVNCVLEFQVKIKTIIPLMTMSTK